MSSEYEKILTGIVELKLGPSVGKTFDRLERRLNRLSRQEGTQREAQSRARSQREVYEAMKKTKAVMDQIDIAEHNLAARRERYRQVTAQITKGLMDEYVANRRVNEVVEELNSLQRSILREMVRRGKINKDLVSLLREKERFLLAILQRNKQIRREEERTLGLVVRTLQEEERMRKAQALERKRQVEQERRMVRIHAQALEINKKITEEREKQRRAQTVMGRLETAGSSMLVIYRKVSAVISNMLRVYWIMLSAIYLIRNVWQMVLRSLELVRDTLRTVVGLVGTMAKEIVKAAAAMESLGVRMRAIFKTRSREAMRWIMAEAVGLPFTWEDIGAAFTRAMIMGARSFAEAKEIVKVGEDMAAAFRTPLERAVQAIMQGAAGHFRSLIETFGFRPEMAVAYGAAPAKTGQGIAGAPQYYHQNLRAIMAMVEARVRGAAEAARNTWDAMIADLQDMWYRLVYEVRDIVVKPLKAVISTLREAFLQGEGMAPWVESLVESFRRVWVVVEDLSKWIQERVGTFIVYVVAFADWLTKRFQSWYEGQGGISGILEKIHKYLTDWGPTVVYILSGIGTLLTLWYGTLAKGVLWAAARTDRQMLWEDYSRKRAEIIREIRREHPLMSMVEIDRDPRMEAVDREYVRQYRQIDRRYRSMGEDITELQRTMGEYLGQVRRKVAEAARGGRTGKLKGRGAIEGLFPGIGESIEAAREKVGELMTWEEATRVNDAILAAHEEGGDYVGDQIATGFDRGIQKIKTAFDISAFIGYTAMAARRGYTTTAAMELAQRRVLEEMDIAAGTPGATITPWPWRQGGPQLWRISAQLHALRTEYGADIAPWNPWSWQNPYGLGAVAQKPWLMTKKWQAYGWAQKFGWLQTLQWLAEAIQSGPQGAYEWKDTFEWALEMWKTQGTQGDQLGTRVTRGARGKYLGAMASGRITGERPVEVNIRVFTPSEMEAAVDVNGESHRVRVAKRRG